MSLIALLVLILLVVAVAPAWPYSRSWGYYPSGLLGVLLVIVVALAFMGRL
jgi:hypothetical protein